MFDRTDGRPNDGAPQGQPAVRTHPHAGARAAFTPTLLSVTGGHTTTDEPIDVINQDLVLRNNVVFGSVNANPRHFKMGASDMVEIEKKWPGVLRQ